MAASERKAIAFIPVRSSSSRLPNKFVKPIGDCSLLEWVIIRLIDSSQINHVVVCIPRDTDIAVLETLLDATGLRARIPIDVFQFDGDVNDVVGRLTKAACEFNADICVLASGDCPLLSSLTIRRMMRYMRDYPQCDRVSIGTLEGVSPVHEGLLVCSRRLWERVDALSTDSLDREHHFLLMRRCPQLFPEFQFTEIVDEAVYYQLHHRMSVDTVADLEFSNAVYDELRSRQQAFTLENAINLLLDSPHLLAINADVRQRPVTENSIKAAMLITAVAGYGYGNLVRACEIARVLIEEQSVAVRFVVLDDTACDYIQHLELPVHKARNLFDENVLSLVADCRVIVCDLNSDYPVESAFITRLRTRNQSCVIIDNISASCAEADAVVIPTVHHVQEISFPCARVVSGEEYVVIRKDIINACNYVKQKQSCALVYNGGKVPESELAAMCSTLQAKEEELHFEWVNRFDDDYPRKLAQAKYYVGPLGISAYEAVYLRTQPVLLAANDLEKEMIEVFYKNCDRLRTANLDQGARRIAQLIMLQVKANAAKNTC